MLEQEIQKLISIINKSQRILLVTHRNPDGDAIGSILAMQNFLISLNKEVTSFCITKPAENFNYLQNIEDIKNDSENLKNQYDLAILLDCGDMGMTKITNKLEEIKFKFGIANIDHHHTNPKYGDINIVISKASSTAEIIYQIMRISHIKITPSIATALLTGIVTDTGNFAYRSTTKQSIETASRLLSIGADFEGISKAHVYNKTIDILKLWGIVMRRIAFNKELKMVTTALFKKDLENLNLNEEAGEGISNYLNNLSKKNKFSLLLKEYETGKVKGSLRTTRDDIDVSTIAQKFGGGGHQKAAGFEVEGKLVFNNGQWQVIKTIK
jgi:bifunctional oligoribonuclease and PAP phosphatase NrnA